MSEAGDTQEVRVETAVGRDLEPVVKIRVGEVFTTVTVESAREIAGYLMEIAEAAEQEAFLMDFATKSLEVGRDEAGVLLWAFRSFREQRRQP